MIKKGFFKQVFKSMTLNIIILNSLIILISITIVSAVSYNISYKTAEEQERDSLIQVTNQIASNLSIYFQESISKINLFRSDKELKENIKVLNEGISERERFNYVKLINEKIRQTIIHSSDIKDIIILSDNYNNNSSQSQSINYNSDLIEDVIMNSENMSKYDTEFLVVNDKKYLYGGENQQNMLVYFPIKDIKGEGTIATMIYIFSFDKINKICRRNDVQREYGCYLIDEDKKLFYTPYSDFQYEKEEWNFEKDITAFKEKEVLFYCKIEFTNWYIGYKIDFSEISNRLVLIKKVTSIVTVIAIIFTIGISVYIGYRATKPIKSLYKTMKKIEDGHLQSEVEVISSFEEIDILYRTYNEMIRKIDVLIKEVYTIKLSKQQAEIEVLQAKINPHFLNNTLQCITSLAIIERNDDIIYVVDALSNLFDYILYETEDKVPIKKELEYIQKYIDIQNIRFNNSINFKIKVDEGIENILVPKLILQPIVENTIQHGFKDKLDDKHILIEGKSRDNKTILKVMDNGNGISKEKYKEILAVLEEEKEPEKHIGLFNVNKRLKLNYSEESGIRINSKEKVYSTITLIL